MTTTDFKKQLPLNLSANLGYFLLRVIIGLWMVPFLISFLGVEAYGFIPLATSVIAYVDLLTFSLNAAVSRYLVIALQKDDYEGANKIFNTAFGTLSLVAVILVPAAALFSYYSPGIFNIPSGLTYEVRWLFFAILISFIVSVFCSVFSVSTFVNNRLDLRNLIEVGNIVSRTFLIVFSCVFLQASLVSVGAAYFAGGCVSLALGYYYFKRLTPELKISPVYFDSSKLSELSSMSGWIVVNQIGSLLFVQIDLIMANILFGAYEAGNYAAIIQWSFLLRTLAGVIAGVLTPMMFISHARDETEKIIGMSRSAVKFMGFGMAVPIGLVCGLAEPILTVWLGRDFAGYTPLLWVLLFHLAINLAVLPLLSVNNTLNRVKVPGLVTFFMGILNLILAVILGGYGGWGLYGIAAAGAIVLTLKNAVFTPFYAAHILKIPYCTFVRPLGVGVLLAAVSMGAGLAFNYLFVIDGWLTLFVAGGMAFILLELLGFIMLGRDRNMLISLLKAGRYGSWSHR